jgi:hypothetical protein
LERTFGDIDATRTAERKLQKIRQQTSASVYASEFQQIISYLDLPDRAYIPYFEAGLKPDVKDELARIDRPDTLDKLIEIAVKIDNRINERKYERREIDQWKRGKSHGFNRFSNGRRDRAPPRDNDPYGPKPMELDATQDEQDERRKKNLCFTCGEPGHRARECKQKRPYEKRQHLRATREGLRATQEQAWTATLRDEPLEDLLARWERLSPEEILAGNLCIEGLADEPNYEYPEIDWDTVESQGWTQYVPQELNCSPGQPSDSQERGAKCPGTPITFPGADIGRGTPSTLPETDQVIPETPHESPKYHRQPRNDEEANELMGYLEDEIWTRRLDQHLINAIEEGDDPTGCPCEDSTCACKGYARHPGHGRMATTMCYDETCTTHGQGKLDYGIEPRPLKWMKKPRWKEEYQGVWYNGRQLYDYKNQPTAQLKATLSGTHIKLYVELPMGRAWTLIDSGATNNFMNPRFKENRQVRTNPLPFTVPVAGLDGEVLSGGVSEETILLPMSVYGHPELIKFNVLETGDYDIVLGIPWLRKHNPSIDWQSGRITFNRCKCKKEYDEYESRRKRAAQRDTGGTTNQSRSRGGIKRSTNRIAPDVMEQSPDMSDQELAEYVIVKQEKLYATSDEPRIPDEYREFQDVFTAPAEGTLPEHGIFDHEINTMEGTEPTFKPIYQLSPKESETLKEYIDENLKKGYIRASKSPAGYPIIFVPKKDGSLRLCVDYRHLNSITIKDRHPLPLIHEIQDRIQGAKYFSKYDITNAYHRIRIKPGHEWKTAFRTKYGHYEYLVMPFGLTNAPATFQRFIFSVLEEYLDIFVVAYLDDILGILQNARRSCQAQQVGTQQVERRKGHSQTQEMRISCPGNGIPWISHQPRRIRHGRRQGQKHSRMAYTKERQGSAAVSWTRELLSEDHRRLRWHSDRTLPIHQERTNLPMGRSSREIVQRTKGTVQAANDCGKLQLRFTNCIGDRRIRLRARS